MYNDLFFNNFNYKFLALLQLQISPTKQMLRFSFCNELIKSVLALAFAPQYRYAERMFPATQPIYRYVWPYNR